MAHKYIDVSILRDVTAPMTFGIVGQDFDRYKIHNIVDEDDKSFMSDYAEYRYYLKEALYMDYVKRGINYRAYIEEGMDARMLMELRKSALIILWDEMREYYGRYSQCETVEDVRRLRIECVSKAYPDYRDFDWQTYTLIRWCWGVKSPDILIDYECCFADGDCTKMGNPEVYRQQFLEQCIPKEDIIWQDWTGVVREPVDWEKYYEGIESV